MTVRARTDSDSLRVRLYVPSDLEPLLKLWRASRYEAFPELEARMQHTTDNDRFHFQNVLLAECEVWVAEIEGEAVGFLARNGELVDQLFVRVDRQRQGIGTSLLAKAHELSPDRLYLFTPQSNRSAGAFYERSGFKVVRYGVSPPPESEPDVEYEWQRSQPTATVT